MFKLDCIDSIVLINNRFACSFYYRCREIIRDIVITCRIIKKRNYRSITENASLIVNQSTRINIDWRWCNPPL